MKFPANHACSACGTKMEARLVNSDAPERQPRIVYKTMPVLICPVCDGTRDPASKKVHAALHTDA